MPMPLTPNLALRRAIKESGYTQTELADAINDAHEKFYGVPGRCTDRYIRQLLSGQVAWPHDTTRLPLEAVLGLPATELGFQSPHSAPPGVTVRTSAPPTHDQEPPVQRRNLGKIVLSFGTLLTLPVLPGAGRLGMSEVTRIRAAETRLLQLDDRHGSARLASAAARYIEHAEHSMRHCTYGSRVQSELHRTLGEMCATAGWFAYDSQQHEEARRHWRTALQYALLAKSPELQARVWACMSRQAVDLGHGAEAVAIARTALDSTRGRRESRLSALLHTRVALGHSVAGERGRSAQSLHRAEQEFDRVSEHPPQWLAFCGSDELAGQAALCAYNLGDYACATQKGREELDLVGGFRRNEFAGTVGLALSLHADGEDDEALAVGHRALDMLPEVRSQRWVDHLDQFRRSIQARGPAGAAEFADRYRKAMA